MGVLDVGPTLGALVVTSAVAGLLEAGMTGFRVALFEAGNAEGVSAFETLNISSCVVLPAAVAEVILGFCLLVAGLTEARGVIGGARGASRARRPRAGLAESLKGQR